MPARKTLGLVLGLPVALALAFGACAGQVTSSSTSGASATQTAASAGPTATVGNSAQPTPTTAPPAPHPTATPTLPPLPPPAVAAAVEFTWRANASNISGDYTVIDNPYTNGNPNAIILVTHNWNPGGVGGVYNNHASGVYFVSNKWAIFNEDRTAMVVNATFNVRVIVNTPTSNACVNGPSHNTITGDGQTLGCGVGSSPGTFSAVFTTPNWNSPGTGVYVSSPLGVYHANLAGGFSWLVFAQNTSTWPSGVTINTSTNGGATNLITTTGASNRDPVNSNSVIVNSAACNGNPNALLQVTQNWNPGANGGTYNNHSVGVWYNTSNSRWEVFNEDGTALPTNASFNVGIN